MDADQIARINALYAKAQSEGLTPDEEQEQSLLRQAYIAAYKENLRHTLHKIKIKNPDGTIVDVKERHDKRYPKSE